MKVVCIHNYQCEYQLTIGKIYEVIINGKYDYKIINDNNDSMYPYKYHFKLLSDIRNMRIDKLLGI
jgi:hypothetical protein